MFRHVALLILTLFVFTPVTAQDQQSGAVGSDPSLERLASVMVRDLSTENEESVVGSLLLRRLQARLADRGFTVVALDSGAELRRSDASEPRVSRAIGAEAPAGVEVVVAAFYRTEDEAIIIQFALLDPVVDVVLGGVLTRARSGLTVSTSIDEAIDELEPVLDRYDDRRYREGPPPGKVERVVISGSQEGVRVRFAELEVGAVRAGRLVVPYSPFPVGTEVPVTLQKTGYHDLNLDIPLNSARNEVALPRLYPASRFGLHLEWTLGFGLGFGAGARIYLDPDQTYLALDHYQSLEISSFPNGRDVRHYDFGLGVGQYLLFGYDSLFRIGVVGGLGVIVTDLDAAVESYPESYAADDNLYNDFYVAGDPFVELNLGAYKVTARLKLHYALGLGVNLLGARWVAPPLAIAGVSLPTVSIAVVHTW